MTTPLPAVRRDHAHHGAAVPCEQFHCTVEHTGDHLLLAPCGDLDATALPRLAGPLYLIGPGTSLVHLDLAAVGFMDSSGLSLLIRARKRCARAGARLEVSGLRPQHRQLLDLLGYTLLLPAAD
ncbi:STAS domain-containing protein [Kitasatospora sp. NPDC051853]|uniref:STAS domain-containing protein n=1 Tax=Kitasatospora sp. NPDC051853 TaxID=3364058 RepID=UPI0037A9BCA0